MTESTQDLKKSRLISDVHDQVALELLRAREKHPDFPSAHHGISVIREEVEELWEHVCADTGRTPAAAAEAIQVAASAIRYVVDLMEVTDADEEREEPQDDQLEYRGIPQRQDIRPDKSEVRENNGRPAGGCGGILAGWEVPQQRQQLVEALIEGGFKREYAERCVKGIGPVLAIVL